MVAGFADPCIYFGRFGAASRVKLINNLLVSIHIAATAEAMALGVKAGVDVELMINAIANGSGGSTQFGIRAPWDGGAAFQAVAGADFRLATLHRNDRRICRQRWAWRRRFWTAQQSCSIRSVAMGLSECDGAAMIDVLSSLPRTQHEDTKSRS